jgi:hypothetical protein
VSARALAARVGRSLLWALFWAAWALAVAAAGSVLAGDDRSQTQPRPDSYLAVTPTSTTLAAPSDVPEPAGAPVEVAR